MQVRKAINTRTKEDEDEVINMWVISKIIKTFRLVGIKVEDNYQQEPVEGELVEGFFIRIATGFERGYKRWSEIGFFYPKEDKPVTPEKWNEIVLELVDMRPFKYHSGHEDVFGRTVFVFVKNKGFLTTRTRRRGNIKEVYVPVNTNTGDDNVKVVVNLYLANMFLTRVRSLEAELTTKQRARLNLWLRYRLLLRGKLRSLVTSLNRFYNYITEFSNRLLSKRNAVELYHTIVLLAELFFTFLKEADKYARKLFKKAFVKKVVESARRAVGVSEVPELLKEAYHYALQMRENAIRSEAENLMRRISSAEIRRG